MGCRANTRLSKDFDTNGSYHQLVIHLMCREAASARPYNLLAGLDLNRDGRLTDRYVDPATGQMVAWYSQRGNPTSLMDLRVTKAFAFGESRRIEVFAEVFNLFNTANFGNN